MRAIELVRAHALRAADAIQLACALLSHRKPPASAEFYLVSADDELKRRGSGGGIAGGESEFAFIATCQRNQRESTHGTASVPAQITHSQQLTASPICVHGPSARQQPDRC